jgi:penicillin-binding protein 1A
MSKSIRFLLISFCIIISLSAGVITYILNTHWVDMQVLEHYNPGKPSILLDDEGNEWARFEIDRRRPVHLHDMPQHLINAFLASEDRDFFNHAGVSWRGMIRSLFVNLRAGRIVQGASTITQQLVKLLFLNNSRRFKRKLKEQCYALLVERQFSKEQILETYLNHVYFGCGIYGVQAASQRFWGKSVGELTLDECAILATIIKSPGYYSPLLAPENTLRGRNTVLHAMAATGIISKEQAHEAEILPLTLLPFARNTLAPHLKETIRIELEELVGKRTLYSGGLTIQTTINQKIQHIAQEEFNKQFIHLRSEIVNTIDGALITIETQTGEIKALIGGFDFNHSKFNRALQAQRQMGSMFKPIVYAAALQKGSTFADVEIDEPLELNQAGNTCWRPQNSTREFGGPMTLARALSYSNNIIAIKTLLTVGCEPVAQLARTFNFSAPINPYPSLALGCIDVTLKEAVAAFNVFAHHGTYCEPHHIRWIKNEWGVKIYQKKPYQKKLLSPHISDQVAHVLSIGMDRFKKRMKKTSFKAHAIGKTGTTNNFRTTWFSGATPHYTTSIYAGCDNNQALGTNSYAIWTVFPIWLNLHRQLNDDTTIFTHDHSLKKQSINWKTGEPAYNSNDPDVVTILIPHP